MKRWTLAVLIILAALPSLAVTTVTTRMKRPDSAVQVKGTFVRFQLMYCGPNQARITGTAVIPQTTIEVTPDATGLVSTTLYGNDVIQCGTVTGNTRWRVTYVVNNQAGPAADYNIVGASFDLTTAMPITILPSPPAPPTGDTTYLRTDLGNVNLLNSSFWNSVPWTAPGTIGSVTPNTGAFSSLTAATSHVTGNHTVDGTLYGPKFKTSDIITSDILTALGDSHTEGYGLPNPSTDVYVAKLATDKGWTLYNKAVSGSMCADQASFFMIETPSAGNNYLVNIGTNDFRVSGAADASKNAQFHGCMMAAVAKLGLPNSQYIRASQAQSVVGQPGCTYSGSWSFPTNSFGQVEAYTTQVGAAITCVTTPGSTVYLFGLSQYNNVGQNMTVTIDGNAVGCNSQTNTCLDATKLSEGGTITTVLGATAAPQVWRWAGLSNNYHTVVVTITGAGSGGSHILGVAAAGSATDGISMPQVMVVQVPRMNATGYASGSGWPGGGGNDAAVSAYNDRIRQVVSDAVQDGLQVSTVDLSSTAVLDPYDPTMMQSDSVHFSAAGHVRLAAAIGNAYSGVNLARNRGAAQILRNVSSFNGGLYAGGPPLNSARGQLGTATGELTGDVTFGHDGCAIRRTASKTWQLAGNCAVGIDFLQFGGTTASYPALKLTGGGSPVIAARKADDSGDVDLQANSFKNTAGNLTPFIIASGTATLPSSALTTTTCSSTVTVAATGAATTDTIVWSYASAPAVADGMFTLQQWPTSGNVNFRLCNPTGGSYTPSGLVVNWKVVR